MIHIERRTHGQLVIDLDDPWIHSVKDEHWLEYPIQYHTDTGSHVRSVWVERTEPDDVIITEARWWADQIDRRNA